MVDITEVHSENMSFEVAKVQACPNNQVLIMSPKTPWTQHAIDQNQSRAINSISRK